MGCTSLCLSVLLGLKNIRILSLLKMLLILVQVEVGSGVKVVSCRNLRFTVSTAFMIGIHVNSHIVG